MELASLRREMRQSRKAAFADGTSRNLITQWKAYFMFCIYFNFPILPSSTNVMCLYVQFLARSMTAFNSIQNYVSGVRSLHLRLGLPFPSSPTERFLLDTVLRGLHGSNVHTTEQAAPMTPHILRAMYELLDVSKPVDAVFWALFLFAFFTLARKSNLVADVVCGRGRQIIRRDVCYSSGGLLVVFHWTKTIQDRSRTLSIPLVSIPGSPLCPVHAYCHMLRLVPALSSNPAFVLPTSSSLRAVTYADFMRVLRHLVGAVGFDPNSFSSHSFRRGGTTFAFQAGVPAPLIQTQGDWASSAYLEYIDMSVERRRLVGSKMRDCILSEYWETFPPPTPHPHPPTPPPPTHPPPTHPKVLSA